MQVICSATCIVVLAGLAQAGTIDFYPGTQQASCGFDGQTCAEPTCYARLDGVKGCSGQTDTWGGDCLGGPSTLTKSICGSAKIVVNNCHDTVCVDFFNKNGDKARFVCAGSGPTGNKCGGAEDGTCADKRLGNC